MTNNRISKVVKQMKDNQNKKTNANDIIMKTLFGDKGPTQEETALRLAQELATALGVPTEGKNLIELLALSKSKLEAVPYVQYPVSFSTVDVLPYTYDVNDRKVKVLLGRKPGQTHFQLVGGFRDPGETSEEAAKRELLEETTNTPEQRELLSSKIDVTSENIVKTIFIDDSRYRDSCHKITTTLFLVGVSHEDMDLFSHGDDIEETRWFILEDLQSGEIENVIRSVHINLFHEVISALELLY
jgi:8-oxo-dGTP pyrophosphatase MutT (NUDIX family)